MKANDDIATFILYYADRSEAPEYAVLIKGAWGSGKTWFIKKIIAELEENKVETLYISLNGINSTTAIDEELFRQVHPVLGSKGMAIAGRIFVGAIKAGFKIDLDGDGKNDANISVQVPKIQIPEKLRDARNVVLVFDDIERCQIALPELLGYINFFVEEGGHKVILIANESELADEDGVERDSSITRRQIAYRRIKEKLIGKTFQIEPDQEAAIRSFVAGLGNERARQAISADVELIAEVFKSSGYENLRHVRQALLDLERLFSQLPEKILGEAPLVREFVAQFLALSFEIKSGRLSASDIEDVYKTRFQPPASDGTPSPYAAMSKKYAQAAFHEQLMPAELWIDFLDKGKIDLEKMEEALSRSKFLAKNEQPPWVGLWHAYQLSDEEIEPLLRNVSSQFENELIDDPGVLLHVTGILLMCSNIGLYDKEPSDVVSRARDVIDQLRIEKKLDSERLALTSHGYGGLGFHQADTEEFKGVRKYLSDSADRAAEESLPDEAAALLVTMKIDSALFSRRIALTNSADNKFYEIPIFAHLTPEAFVGALVEVPSQNLYTVAQGIKQRYQFDSFNKKLYSEREWLENIAALLKRQSELRKKTMFGKRMADLSETFEEALKLLEATPK